MMASSLNETFTHNFIHLLDDLGYPKKGHGRSIILAKQLETSIAGAQKWLNCNAIPSTPKLVKICEMTGVNLNWLLYSEGPMYRKSQQAPIDPLELNSKLLDRIMTDLERMQEEMKVRLTSSQKAKIVSMIYKSSGNNDNTDYSTLMESLISVLDH